MSDRVLNYKRVGPDATHGFKYEYGMTCLAYLRCEKLHQELQRYKNSGVKSFFVANNVKNIGVFDDVVIRVEYFDENTIKTKLIFAQCKHVEDAKSNSNSRFKKLLNNIESVQKYFDSFLRINKILNQIEIAGLPKHEQECLLRFLDCSFEDCEFLFYSNIDLRYIENYGMLESAERVKDITEIMLGTKESSFLRLKNSAIKTMNINPTLQDLFETFCQKFTIVLQKDGNIDEILRKELRSFLKSDKNLDSICNLFKEETEYQFNSSTSCEALSEIDNLVERTKAFNLMKQKSVNTICQFQMNPNFQKLFSEQTIQKLQEKFSSHLEDPIVLSTNFKELEKRKIVQSLLKDSDSIFFLSSEDDVRNWLLARPMRVYRKLKKVYICSEVEFALPERFPEPEEIIVQIFVTENDADELPNIEEFSDETRNLLGSTQVCFQGHSQELRNICGNMINVLFDETMLCDILNGSAVLKFCDPLDAQEIYTNRKFKTRILKFQNVVQKDAIMNNFHPNSSILVFSETNKKISNSEYTFRWFDNLENARSFLQTFTETKSDTIHLCAFTLQFFMLIYSLGGESKLVCHESETEINLLTRERELSKLVILADIAGMGKTTTLNHLANKYKELNPSHWVFFIELSKYLDKLMEIPHISDTSTAIKFVATQLINLKDHEYRAFVRACTETGNVALLFDAFDEVSPDAEQAIKLLLQTLKQTRILCQYVSSRLNYVRSLEQHFFQNSIKFIPLESHEKEGFLLKQWQSLQGNEVTNREINAKKIKFDICEYLRGISNEKELMELLSIPLQLKMLAEVQYDNFKLKPQTKESKTDSKLDIYTLYNDFCELQARRYCVEKEGQNWTCKKEGDRKIAILAKLAGIEKIACKLMCPEFDIPEDENMRTTNSVLCDQLGLLTHVNPPRFLHRTYGEFLAARYIVKQLESERKNDTTFTTIMVEKILSDHKYDVLRKFIDPALAHSKVLNHFDISMIGEFGNEFGEMAMYTAVSECHVEIIKILIKYNPHIVNVRYSDKMTPLLIACEDDKNDVASFLINTTEQLVNIKDSEGKSALHFATENENIYIMNILLQRDHALLNDQKFCRRTALHIACKKGKSKAAKHLLTYPNCLVSIADIYGRSAIHYAAEEGNTELIDALLRSDKNQLNMQDICGMTILHCAINNDHVDIVKNLATYPNLLVNLVDWRKQTVLHYAAETGNSDVIELLIQLDQSLINIRDCFFSTPLHIACQFGKYEAIKCLLAHSNCMVNIKDMHLKNVLHHLAKDVNFNSKVEIIKQLLERDISMLNEQDINGDTLFHIACSQGDIDVVKHLLTYDNCLVHVENNNKETALHRALNSRCMNIDIVNLLIRRDSTLLQKNHKFGNTALHLACSLSGGQVHRYPETLKDLGDRTGKTATHIIPYTRITMIMKCILEHDYTLLNKQNCDGKSPLHIASYSEDFDAAEFLLSSPNCLVDLVDSTGKSALHYAVQRGNTSIMHLLLQRNPRLLNTHDADGNTPLIIACKHDKLEPAKFLLSYADCVVNFKDKKGKNALHYARANSNIELIKTIIDRDPTLLNRLDLDGVTPLHIACIKYKTDASVFLLPYPDHGVSFRDHTYECALHDAAENGLYKTLKLTLEHDQTLLNMQNDLGMTPLHFACKRSQLDAVNYLLSFNDECSLNILDKHNRTVLHYATDTEIIKLLLQRDTSLLNRKDCEGNTPLHLACHSNKTDAVKYLLSLSDCLVDIENNLKQTPFHCIATDERYLELGIVHLLLERDNTLLNRQDNKDQTLMHILFKCSYCGEIDFLFNETNFIADLKDNCGNTYLHVLAGSTYFDVLSINGPIKLLLEKAPHLLNMTNNEGRTALHNAANLRNDRTIDILLDLSACVEIVKDANGDTPLHLFINSKHDNDDDDVDYEDFDHYQLKYLKLYFVKRYIRNDPSLLNMQNKAGETPLHRAVLESRSRFVLELLHLGSKINIKDNNGNSPLDLANQLEYSLRKVRILHFLQTVDDNSNITNC